MVIFHLLFDFSLNVSISVVVQIKMTGELNENNLKPHISHYERVLKNIFYARMKFIFCFPIVFISKKSFGVHQICLSLCFQRIVKTDFHTNLHLREHLLFLFFCSIQSQTILLFSLFFSWVNFLLFADVSRVGHAQLEFSMVHEIENEATFLDCYTCLVEACADAEMEITLHQLINKILSKRK